MTETYVKEEVAWRTMVKLPLSNSFLERRDAPRKFSDPLGAGATHSSADLTWIRKWLEIQAPELSELESVEPELVSCCSDLDKQVSDEICRTRKRSHFVFRPRHAPHAVTSCLIPPSFSQTKKNWLERLLPRPSTPQTLTHMWNSFSSELPL